MLAVVLAILILPLAAGVVCLIIPARLAAVVTAASGIASFGLVLVLVPEAAHGDLSDLSGYLRADAVSVIFLLATGFLYGAVAVYAAGYLKGRDARYVRRCYAGLNAFAWAMLAAPLMGSLALLWIAIEVTTVISALLVAIEDTDQAAEAAWKYVLIASAGLSLALLATIFAYYAGAQVLGEHYNLAVQPLIDVAAKLPKTPVRLAFLLALVGYGTKVGLFPVHTWLPDAHSEAPTPVSALLSARCSRRLLRDPPLLPGRRGGLGSGFPRGRAAGLRGRVAAARVAVRVRAAGRQAAARLLQRRAHGHPGDRRELRRAGRAGRGDAARHGARGGQGNAFMGAGVFTVKFGTKEVGAMRDGMRLLPWSGPLFLLAVFALSALPPSGIFRSEFQIVAGGLAAAATPPRPFLVILVTLAFFGLATSATAICCPRQGRPG